MLTFSAAAAGECGKCGIPRIPCSPAAAAEFAREDSNFPQKRIHHNFQFCNSPPLPQENAENAKFHEVPCSPAAAVEFAGGKRKYKDTMNKEEN